VQTVQTQLDRVLISLHPLAASSLKLKKTLSLKPQYSPSLFSEDNMTSDG